MSPLLQAHCTHCTKSDEEPSLNEKAYIFIYISIAYLYIDLQYFCLCPSIRRTMFVEKPPFENETRFMKFLVTSVHLSV